MSFGAFSNHVRNAALPHQRRVSALRSCVQLYRPIGFNATLSFLEKLAGPFQGDEQALIRAHEQLTTSRTLWHEHLASYADQRRTAKRLGHRKPRKTEVNPNLGPSIWYGAPREAALHALSYWRRSRLPELLVWKDPGAQEIDSAVSAYLTNGGLFVADQHQQLESAVQQIKSRIRDGLYAQDQAAYFRGRDLLHLAGFVSTASANQRED